MIKLSNISKSYDNKLVLDNISLQINQGDFIAIVGKSGSGKTTLLNILGGLIPFMGEYYFENESIGILKDKSRFRRDNIGYIFQRFYLDNSYSIYENVEVPLIIKKEKDYKEKILNILDYVGLSDINKSVGKLSGGEAQRVAIARALVTNPKVILADEPTGSLDEYNKKNIMELFKKLNNDGKTIILVTHDLDDASYANRIIEIKDGKIV